MEELTVSPAREFRAGFTEKVRSELTLEGSKDEFLFRLKYSLRNQRPLKGCLRGKGLAGS